MPVEQVRNFGDLEELARERLDAAVWDFLEGGAGQESSVAANRSAFSRWSFRPRILAGNPPADLSTRFIGLDLSLPFITAPFGADGLFDDCGQIAVAEAAEQLGALAMAPHVSTFPMEDIRAAASRAAAFFQLHPVGSEDNFLRLVARAEDAGFKALCVTADCPTAGYRDRVLSRQFVYEDVMTGNYDDQGGRWPPDEMFGEFRRMSQRAWTFEKLQRLMSRTDLPFVVKGVMTAEDARRCVDIGAAGLVVSNHGGRQLDCAPGTLEQLPEIASAIGGQIGIALDGGVRRGTDVVKALALGADVVMLGRLVAIGLAAAGRAGVVRALEMLRDEMTKTMELVGRGSVGDLDETLLQASRSPHEEARAAGQALARPGWT